MRITIRAFAFFFLLICTASAQEKPAKEAVYMVARLKKPMAIDANWDKKEWKNVTPLDITLIMGDNPKFKPATQVKMMYDDENIYVIFHVRDQFVSIMERQLNGPVHLDAAVEFFLSPDEQFPGKYINLETNGGGVPHFAFHEAQGTRGVNFKPEDLQKIPIATSLPKVVEKEITGPVTWTLEYRIPLEVLRSYTTVTQPKPGVTWKGNFYKTATNTSNPHWITWAFVDLPTPSFHQPGFFGILKFE